MWGPAGASPAWGLSPLRNEGPGSPPPATPGALYRSCFATECEAIALQLGTARGRSRAKTLPTPLRGALTVEAETLTPLEASWSFLGEPRPAPLGEGEEEEAGQAAELPPSPRNLTYDASATSLGEWTSEGPIAPRPEEEADGHRTFERPLEEVPLSFVASTPVSSKVVFPPPPQEEKQQQGAAEVTRPPRSDLVKACLRGREALLAPPKGTSDRKRLVRGRTATEGAPASGAQQKFPRRRSMALPETAVKSQPPLGQKLPLERKNSLSKLPCNKKPPLSTRLPSKLSRVPELLAGLAQPGVGRENKSPATKLPVRAAGGYKASQKCPLERRLVAGAITPQQQSASERSRPGRSHIEKPPCGALLDAGEIPTAALTAAPCSQCQQLAEENQRLKNMLENYERTITALKQKKQLDENN